MRPDDPDEVLRRMAGLTEQRRGWINFEPVVDTDPDSPPVVVPLCTWSPGERRRRRNTPPVVGIQHHAGRKVADELGVPDRWVVVQDHGRRGLVLNLPPEESHARTLAWLLDAGAALAPAPVRSWAVRVFAMVG